MLCLAQYRKVPPRYDNREIRYIYLWYRDYIKVMSLIGLRAAVHSDSSGPSLEEILNG